MLSPSQSDRLFGTQTDPGPSTTPQENVDVDAQEIPPPPSVRPRIHGLHRWCYILHILLCTLHLVLLVVSRYHLEHAVTIPFDNTVLTTGLSVFLQAFYTVCGPLLEDIDRPTKRHRCLTALHSFIGLHNSTTRIVCFPFPVPKAHHYARHIRSLERTRSCHSYFMAANQVHCINFRNNFSVLILDMHFCPARRIASNHGVPTVQCFNKNNCYVEFDMARPFR